MVINNYTYKISSYISIFTVILAFYAFGAFGFFNLFDARRIIQLIVVIYMFFSLIVILYSYQTFLKKINNEYLLGIIVFFFLYYGTMMSIIRGEFLITYINSIVMMIFCLLLIYIEMKYIKKIAEIIVIITFIMSIMIVIGYIVFILDPTVIDKVNFNLYHSDTGDNMICPQHWVEYLTFTSGDGFVVSDIGLLRLKGFSPEPSATVLHYLAPVGLAFLLSRKYRIIGSLILLVNIFAISSLMSWLIFLLSFMLYYVLSIKSIKKIKFILYCVILCMLFIMLNFELAYMIFMEIGYNINDIFGVDLMARKEGSLDTRLLGYIEGIKHFISNPLGGSSYSTPTSLILNVSLVGGFFLFFIMVLFLMNIIELSIYKYKSLKQKSEKFGISFLLSTVFIAMFLSEYGWSTVSGVIMMIIFFRLVKDPINLKVYNLGSKSAK